LVHDRRRAALVVGIALIGCDQRVKIGIEIRLRQSGCAAAIQRRGPDGINPPQVNATLPVGGSGPPVVTVAMKVTFARRWMGSSWN